MSAFQDVSAKHLNRLEHAVDCDVLVCGDESKACATVINLCEDRRVRGLYAGSIANSAAAEALTSVLIQINRRYAVPDGAGIKVTGPAHA
ncbi:MAG: Rossmann-fold NAD(P)-binding domain-containing protein [Steroidobacteraceae bacterium]